MKPTRIILPIVALSLPLIALALFLTLRTSTPATDRPGRLLSMAGEEAANIPNVLDRFTRQLNIADTQLRTGRKQGAAQTLALARDTLTVAKKADFDDFHRIAAWTAISQLARASDDRPLALASSDLALAALNDVQPAAERPQYVLSLAAELADLRGKTSAIELLDNGGSWAAGILDADTRRIALIAFTDRLLSYDGFENARTMLHRDPDPAWRTDTFLALAGGLEQVPDAHNDHYARAQTALPMTAAAPTIGGRGGAGAGGFRADAEVLATPPANQPQAQANMRFRDAVARANSYGKDVRFENVYKQSN